MKTFVASIFGNFGKVLGTYLVTLVLELRHRKWATRRQRLNLGRTRREKVKTTFKGIQLDKLKVTKQRLENV